MCKSNPWHRDRHNSGLNRTKVRIKSKLNCCFCSNVPINCNLRLKAKLKSHNSISVESQADRRRRFLALALCSLHGPRVCDWWTPGARGISPRGRGYFPRGQGFISSSGTAHCSITERAYLHMSAQPGRGMGKCWRRSATLGKFSGVAEDIADCGLRK